LGKTLRLDAQGIEKTPFASHSQHSEFTFYTASPDAQIYAPWSLHPHFKVLSCNSWRLDDLWYLLWMHH